MNWLLRRVLGLAPPTPAPVRRRPTLSGLPRTFGPAAAEGAAERARVFDPALRQYPHAFRPSDPSFVDDAAARRWSETRRRITDHVLRTIAESPRGDGLILRGSRMMSAWFGDAARVPGDLDWVATPSADGSPARPDAGLAADLVVAVLARPAPAGVRLLREGVETDDIWTYERAPGRRIVFPWRAEGLPGGAVQVDVVFGETLAEPPRRSAIPVADGGCVSVLAAGPAQSLAWKLLWLATDINAQGKDLYDAVLLAERFNLPWPILDETLRRGGADPPPATAAAFVRDWGPVDWDNVQADAHHADPDPDAWLSRLAAALEPTFAGRAADPAAGAPQGQSTPGHSHPPGTGPRAWLDWDLSTVRGIADRIDREGAFHDLPILADALDDAGCDEPDLTAHCRAGGPHTRGCWVVDRILAADRNAPESPRG